MIGSIHWLFTIHPVKTYMHQYAVEPQQLTRSLLLADQFYYEENTRSPVRKRPSQEQTDIFIQYQTKILQGAGIEVTSDVASRIMVKTMALARKASFTLYEDTLPTLNELIQQGLVTGLITNIDQDILPICHKIGIAPLPRLHGYFPGGWSKQARSSYLSGCPGESQCKS